ncbi:unnamed protein product [Schistosoma margrebowiei]|uniref:DNA polymerase kappa n=2 Tax=Schistosoma margrebowiei TaxID=48269 RepID=A0AA84ZTR7_9TREM|nr:unnamed protein product [Schistosoma margrebowiei]
MNVDLEGCCRYSTSKAGMEGLDKATIMNIILENSKGSKFYENELRREKALRQQIEQKLKVIKSLTPAMLKSGELEADHILNDLRQKRRFSRIIVHVDMDAFYAAVEIRDQPELRHHPVAVGSNSMLSTSNYIARRFGVRAGLPGFLGKKLCPQLKIIPCDFVKYTAASRVVRSILMEYTVSPESARNSCESDNIPFSAVSLDEAYLDITDHLVDRSDFPVERRTFWPRPAPGAPMLVCRCRSRSKHPQSHLNSSCTDDQSEILIDDNSESNSNSCKETDKSSDKLSVRIIKPKYSDPELDVCIECGLLCKSGRRIFGLSAWEAVREMRFRVFCATRLTCSAGLGPNTLIAKIASDWIKPCGQHEIANTLEAVDKFMQTMPVRKVPGIGHVTERRLDAFGIKTCADLIDKRGLLWHVSTKISMVYYMRIALGHSDDRWLINVKNHFDEKSNKPFGFIDNDSENIVPSAQSQVELNRKSMSVERTFSDTSDENELMHRCEQLAQMLSTDLKEEHVKGQLITLKMKLDTFEIRTRSQLLPDYTNHTEIINSFGRELLREEMVAFKSNTAVNKPLTLRLMGLRMSNLLPVEMCPQIRQRSVEEAFMFAITSNNTSSEKNPSTISKTLLHTETSIKSHNMITSPKSVESTKNRLKKLTKSSQKNDKKKMVGCNSSSLITQWTKPSPLTRDNEVSSPSSFISLNLSLESSLSLLASSSSSNNNTGYFFTCPVCERDFQFSSEDKFNYHLDECLNRSTILEVVKETLTDRDYCSTTITQSNHLNSSSDDIGIRKAKSQKLEVKQSKNSNISTTKTMTTTTTTSHGPLDKFLFNSSTVHFD